MVLSVDRYLSAVRADTERVAVAATGRAQVPVPSCPGWSMADLVWHLREVQWFWATVVAERLPAPPTDRPRPVRPEDPAQLVAELRQGGEALLTALREADPATPCWTWARQQDVGFVIRHQAQEAAVHRWDAQRAAALADPGAAGTSPPPVDPIAADLAADAIEEFLTHTPVREVAGPPRPGSVELSRLDGTRFWVVTEDAEARLRHRGDDRPAGPGGSGGAGTEVAGTEVAGTEVAGTASDLLLALYGRVGDERLEVRGDPAGWRRLLTRYDLS